MNYLFLTTFGETFNYILYILLAILVLLVMITVHEFGHFITGKIFKFGIEEFSIGFGPKVFSKKKDNGEVFSIRALPLGGYCAFKGEDEDNKDENAFNNKKPWQRIIVLISGALMNYLLSILIIIGMFSGFGTNVLVAYDVYPNEYAVENSLAKYDKILKVEGRNIYLTTDIMNAIQGKEKGDKVKFTVISNGEKTEKEIILLTDTHFKSVEDTEKLCSALGIVCEINSEDQIERTGFAYQSVKLGFFQTVGKSFEYSFKLAGTVFTVLGQLITGSIGIKSVGGTITTISVTASAIKAGGLWSLLNISAFIGVNLAVFNLLPIPALDGSRVVFTIIEWIRKKPVNRKVEGLIHTVGFILILLFAVFVDLQQCF